jgi:tetratricopeptide (TPR) repeat protein
MKGKALNGRTSLAALSLAAAIAAPLAARAQTSGVTYYSPPSILKRGTNSSPIAGAGTVVVQVMVNKDGTFKVTRVIHSTNTGDNAAALEIAKSSTYKPAARGAEKQTAFYDFTLKFTSTGAAAATSQSGPAAGAAQYERMIRAGNYSGAQSGLKTYLAQHPEDENAEQLLGVASSFLNNDEDAAAAFDKGGTISSNYKSVAAKAYADYAVTAQKNNEPDKAVAAAKKAVALEPGFYYYNTLGSAEASAGQNDAAIADLEKARSLGTSEKASDRALVDANLASAYLSAGKPDMAKQVGPRGRSSIRVRPAYKTYLRIITSSRRRRRRLPVRMLRRQPPSNRRRPPLRAKRRRSTRRPPSRTWAPTPTRRRPRRTPTKRSRSSRTTRRLTMRRVSRSRISRANRKTRSCISTRPTASLRRRTTRN